MKRHQILIIIGIILIPVIIGIVLMGISATQYSDTFSLSGQQKKIGLVKIFDIIYSSESHVKQLEELRKDNSVAGVILRINSPGGGVAPSQEIFQEVLRFRQANKPVVVSMGNVAASGGYYIASASERIFANPGTITGSIGVIFQFPHYYDLLNKIGIKMTTIKSGKYKDIGNPNRDLTTREKAFLQKLLDNTHTQFIDDVALARSMELSMLKKIADGRIFTGQQALEAELVDTLGGFSAAVAYLKEALDLPEKTKVVEKKSRPQFLRDIISERFTGALSFVKRPDLPAGCYFLLQNF